VQGIACENRKHLLIADDADTFAAAVVSLLKDEGLRKKLSYNAAQQVAEVYDNNKVLIRLLNFYSQQITQKKYTHVI
jgi:glycosyltransferase involved in cell wall biosynthesis